MRRTRTNPERKERPEQFTERSGRFLTTVSVRAGEIRPAGLPHSPEEAGRPWLTKQTEPAYDNARANERFRRDCFLRTLEGRRKFPAPWNHGSMGFAHGMRNL